jgi:methionyl-tRNA synthetase
VNSDLVGKYANLLASGRPDAGWQTRRPARPLDAEGCALVEKLAAAREGIVADYEGLNYASVVRAISALADEANRYVELKQPWAMIKVDPEQTRATLTAVLNAMKVLTIYLKPILPKFAEKVEKFLNVAPWASRTWTGPWKIIRSARLNDCSRELTRNRYRPCWKRVRKARPPRRRRHRNPRRRRFRLSSRK